MAPFSVRRSTALGLDIESDHRDCAAVETLAFHKALKQWRTDLVIDVAINPVLAQNPHDVEIAVRFVPDADGQPSPKTAAFARAIRTHLDGSERSYRVTLAGCLVGSLTEARGLGVVELTAGSSSDPRVVQAMIEATIATYRATTDTAVPTSV